MYLMGKIPINSCKHGTTICKYTAIASASQNGAVGKGNITHANQVNKRHACNPQFMIPPPPRPFHPPSLQDPSWLVLKCKGHQPQVAGNASNGQEAASGSARDCPQVGLKKRLVLLPLHLPNGEHGQGAPKYSPSHRIQST